MSLLTAAKHELRQVGLVTLHFMFCFAVILTLKKLFLAEYQIEFYTLSAVVIGGLVAGKVVVVLDHTPLGTLFDSSERPGLAAVYRTLVYRQGDHGGLGESRSEPRPGQGALQRLDVPGIPLVRGGRPSPGRGHALTDALGA
jgi:hypothetical protein